MRDRLTAVCRKAFGELTGRHTRPILFVLLIRFAIIFRFLFLALFVPAFVLFLVLFLVLFPFVITVGYYSCIR